MRIDSHQHFWIYNPIKDSWMDDSMEVIKKDFLPKALKPILKKNRMDGCIAVQADQSEVETHFLLKFANENAFIKGVVGWVDLCADNVDSRLACFSKYKKFCGVRHIVQAEPVGFLLNKKFQEGIKLLETYNLSYDILVYHNQLEEVVSFVQNFPNQRFVLDHIGKPSIKTKEIEQWKFQLNELAKFPNVYCKISGLITETTFNKWEASDFTPYLDVVVKSFGIDRLLFGSDWPVCLLSGSYEDTLNLVENYFEVFSEKEKAQIMGENAQKFYNITLNQ
jgi:L-fuconolactonase